MSTIARRRTAKVALVLSILGGAGLVANNALLSPTADGGLPGSIGPIRTIRTVPYPTISPTVPPTYVFTPGPLVPVEAAR